MYEIREQIKKTIKDLYGLDFTPEITPSPENIDADYSTNAPLKLAKELHKSPMEIANEMVTELETFVSIRDNGSGIASEPRNDGRERSGEQKFSTSQPGFINVTISDDYLSEKINELSDAFLRSVSSDAFKDKTVICEFSDPNPFKVLHVGHLYTSIVGDSIARLFEYAGAKVVRANFGGDVGLHVAKTMYVLKEKSPEELTIEDIAKCYVEGTALYEDDENAKQEITKLNKEIYKINSENIHDTPLAELYWRGRELSYDYFKDFYDSIGVTFDKYYPESSVADLGLKKVKEELEKGVYEVSDGAVIFDGEKHGLHTRVFINKEGVPTYETKDVGLIFTKWEDYHFNKSVVITGSEQLEYMKVVLKSVEQYAPELVEKTSHLTHGLVKLPGNVKMSSRKGNFLKAVDVLDMVREELKNEYDSTDEKVSLGATKYAFLKYKMGGNIIFDPKESVKMTGNSGPYLLYSCVRAKKILDKASSTDVIEDISSDSRACSPSSSRRRQNESPVKTGGRVGSRIGEISSAEAPFEKSIIKKLLEYKSELDIAVSEMAPHKLANYLYELAQDFSRFYENCPVNGSERESERLKIVKIYLETMTHGLNILGIEIPEEM
ncbi:arginine--tRNA ligase [Candidatus Saccharibacteria bacterium]|nr:arginine--tRNA ligase [Candidatus Saccharibacteria bacterium]